jgi:microcystin-dependent protein
MSEAFLSEIRIMSFNFAPKGWAECNGANLPINQNQALFSLLGTMYGGDGRTTFALPDLRGRAPLHVGAGHIQGERGGEVSHTLTVAEFPAHTHAVMASGSPVTSNDPAGRLAGNNQGRPYAALANQQPMRSTAIGNTGGNQPHENMQPYLALNFCIALQGIFPSRN